MATITTRSGKGSPLTNTEVDDNFTNLNTDKIENVVEDTSPQLGGNLDLNGNNIDGTGNIVLTSGGLLTISGNITTLSGDISASGFIQASGSGGYVRANTEVRTPKVTSQSGDDLTLESATSTIKIPDGDFMYFGNDGDVRIGMGSYFSSQWGQVYFSGQSGYILAQNDLYIKDSVISGETMASFIGDGAVSLYYDNALKIATTSAGIDVTGDITVSGNVDGKDVSTLIANVVEDTTPQLGGDLDCNSHGINVDQGDIIDVGGLRISTYNTYNSAVLDTNGSAGISGSIYLAPKSGSSVYIKNGASALFSSEHMAQFLANGAVNLYYDNQQKFATTSTGIDVTGSVVSQISINAQTGTTYTTVLGDQCKLVTLTNASAITLTIPPNSSVAYPVGTKIDLAQLGAGQVTVAAGSGVTVNSTPTLKLRAQYSAASCIKTATDTWLLVGDLAES